MHRYSVYGVGITSQWPLAFPAPRDRTVAEVELVDGTDDDFFEVDADRDPDGPWCLPHVFADRSTYAAWSGLYDFRIPPDGSRIVCRPLNGCDRAVLQNFLFGQALAFALVFQGLEPLHASVLEIDGVAIGFLGDSSFGKSTLVASFLQAGHRIVTDDLLMLVADAGQWMALPGSGRIKLHPDSAGAFLRETGPGEPLNAFTLKRSFPLEEVHVQRTALPLKHFFILPTPEQRQHFQSIRIQPTSRVSLFRELLKNSSNAEIVTPERLARQFSHAAQVASVIGAFSLQYPEGLHHLPHVCQSIVDIVRRVETQPRSQ